MHASNIVLISVWLISLCLVDSERIACCVRCKNLCDPIWNGTRCRKIYINGQGKQCGRMFVSLTSIKRYEFIAENSNLLDQEFYTIVLVSLDSVAPTRGFEDGEVVYSAVNVPRTCFVQNSVCIPPQFFRKDSNIRCNFNRYFHVNILLLPQVKWINAKTLGFHKVYVPYSVFYNRSIFVESPVRGNSLVWKKCSRRSEYGKYLLFKGIGMDDDLYATRHIGVYPPTNVVSRYFRNVIYNRRMVLYEGETCFLAKELNNSQISFRESLLKQECKMNMTQWVHKRADAWFVYGQKEFVHYQKLKLYRSTFKGRLEQILANSLESKFKKRKELMMRIVSRLQYLSDVLYDLGICWDIPANSYIPRQ
ncbi:unnamed protein product [Calicophoron daubneyi]|uniref:Uncharacterized protein n=1 Tax=Calicophoron daubneyi TaxID=300641 RepID=A0AAV2TNG5_CALDB